jgi:predicted alpha/beta-hydrolase family hydrolase
VAGTCSSRELRFEVGEGAGSVSGLLLRAPGADRLLVLAHGAGAGMRHPFLSEMAGRLAERRIATLRFQFPYMEAGRRSPDRPPVATAAVRAAVAAAAAQAPSLALFAGGKSFGGRMTSTAAAVAPLASVRGLVFLGFPLHAVKRPSAERGAHLREVGIPMLFLQGERDELADLALLTPVCAGLGTRASLHVVAGADHSFRVRKRSGRSDDEILDELAEAVDRFTGALA